MLCFVGYQMVSRRGVLADCISRTRSRRASLQLSYRARCSMSRSTFAGGLAFIRRLDERGTVRRNRRQMWIPADFAHGFQALCDETVFGYKCTEYNSVAEEHSLLWNDVALGIEWPLPDPVVSEKDASALRLAELPEAASFGGRHMNRRGGDAGSEARPFQGIRQPARSTAAGKERRGLSVPNGHRVRQRSTDDRRRGGVRAAEAEGGSAVLRL
jgi:hypothetical protein